MRTQAVISFSVLKKSSATEISMFSFCLIRTFWKGLDCEPLRDRVWSFQRNITNVGHDEHWSCTLMGSNENNLAYSLCSIHYKDSNSKLHGIHRIDQAIYVPKNVNSNH